ncbi:MAG TPA: hypothetical protein VLI90_16545 [Tepidisphaeraceae bacterium]|nr:hypothetical protein [Tepidisphaeraceae bacterium]
MMIELNGFVLQLSLSAALHGQWISLPIAAHGAGGFAVEHKGIRAQLHLTPERDRLRYQLSFSSTTKTRLRFRAELLGQRDLFHLIPGNIHGDNNAAHVRPGEFPCLTSARPAERNCSPLWEFRADRASHPVSTLCSQAGAAGISIDPYSPSDQADDGFIRNGVFAELPNAFGVALGYGNDPLTFVQKTQFTAATCDIVHEAAASGFIFAVPGDGRLAAHDIIRALHQQLRDIPMYSHSYEQALRALADAFAQVSWSNELQQYTNRKCRVPVDRELQPWRAIVEIGWTGGSMLAYPFTRAERIFSNLKLPKTGGRIFDEICTGFNAGSGFINDAALNRFTQNIPDGWNTSQINGWWSGFLPQTLNNHCAYNNAHAAYYLLRGATANDRQWIKTALAVLDTAVELQRADGAFGYIFSSTERKVIDWDGFAGCWFAPALVLAWRLTGSRRYLESASRAMRYYWPFVRALTCWGSPMDTYKSIDSEGNLAFIRGARLMHEFTGDAEYLTMLRDGAHYEYLWRYGFRTRPQCPPLKGSAWNSCGGSLTSVSNAHIHPMSVVATEDLKYLAKQASDNYHDDRATDGIAWLMNTMELYPDTVGYGRYGVLSERTCPSDGLLAETYADDGSPASTWWSYNAWAAGSAMEAIAERVLAQARESGPLSHVPVGEG